MHHGSDHLLMLEGSAITLVIKQPLRSPLPRELYEQQSTMVLKEALVGQPFIQAITGGHQLSNQAAGKLSLDSLQGVCQSHAERGTAEESGEGMGQACRGPRGPHHRHICPESTHKGGPATGGSCPSATHQPATSKNILACKGDLEALSSANGSPCRADFTCIGFRAPLIGLAWHVSSVSYAGGLAFLSLTSPMQPLVHLISRKGLFWDLDQMNVLLPGVRSCCIWA